ncbi:hypothetical protein PC129_g380 [Phytophthora cactorum]|uniref:Uncharacterized protein n=1 Tax=Phytophthora cactorum TaxID=29920 RepID=A0A8T1L3Z2_9STRA|nr:hypothetical protein GQ600_7434 [Phytophthora cactorum]KAG2786910.1 hypothetical protein Pcac1_g3835 [Phytophthora cactorum]KAG2918331.1 hypothetical protein PC114_g6862 [Phytophthora cactorum]KAG3027012.1 hypothetical protein PC120_g5646 [Phytophthora cactorum]KAG3029609.1 hypothetical protein PC119_g6544 [Phytophthora cactorum]
MLEESEEATVAMFFAIGAFNEGTSRRQEHTKVRRLLGLTTSDGQRFFQAIHGRQNRYLFRDHIPMDVDAFDQLFELCKPFISDTVQDAQ